MQASRLSIAIALGLVYIVWGSTYLAIRYAVETLPPFSMAAVRFLVAGALLYGWARLRGAPRPQRRHWTSAMVVGGFLLLGGNGAVVWAEQEIASSLAALLVTTTSLWMVIIDWRVNGRLPSVGVILGLLVGFGGVALLLGPEGMGGATRLVPALVVLLGAFLWASGSVFGGNIERSSSPLLASGMEMIAGGLGLSLLGILVGEPRAFDVSGVSATSLFGLLYLVVFGSLVGFTAYSWLLRHAPLSLVSTYAYVNPVVAVLLGWSIAGEELSLRMAIASAIIVGSVAWITLLQRPRRQAPARHPAEAGDQPSRSGVDPRT